MNYTGYPIGSNPDYSPAQEMLSYPDQLGSTYIPDNYTTSPGFSLESFFDQAAFPSADGSTIFPKDQGQYATFPSSGAPTTNDIAGNKTSSYSTSRHPSDAAPLGKLEQFSFGFSFDALSTEPFERACFSPNTHISSRTPSLCGDASEKTSSPSSLTLSPCNLKRESPSSPDSASEEQSTPPRPQRKRGRPRLDRNETISSTSSPKGPKTGRLPHNQVERKYREGLNAELERLRRAVPTLTQSDEAGAMGQPKPSKAMVLASAIEYIQKLEAERDALKLDNERLRQGVETGQTIRTWDTEDESLQDYLTDA